MRRVPEEWLDAPGRLQPQVVNKAREWLDGSGEQALGDWDISRDAPYFGIPIPDAPGQVLLRVAGCADRLPRGAQELLRQRQGARTRGELRSFEEFLGAPDTEQIHFIGKDIIYFHTLFWPAMLKFAGAPYKVPDHVYVHGFLTVSGEKMSKSRGTGISPLRYLELGMNAEWLRYYIAAKLNASVEDLDFNPDDFVARVNSDLVGKYVNIASRAANFITRHFDGRLAYQGDTDAAASPRRAPTPPAWRRAYEEREFGTRHARHHGASPTASTTTSTRASPGCWRRTRRAPRSCRTCARARCYGFKLLSVLLAPVLPQLAARVARSSSDSTRRFAWTRCRGACRAASIRYQHLMTRVDPKQLDALFEAEPPPRRRPCRAPPRRSPAAAAAAPPRDDLDRRIQAHRPARRAHRRRRDRRRRRQAAEADARPGGRRRAPCSPASSRAYEPGEAHRPPDGRGRQPRAAQDEVRRSPRAWCSRRAATTPGLFLLAPDAGATPGMKIS